MDNLEERRDSGGRRLDRTMVPVDLRIQKCPGGREEKILEQLPKAKTAEIFPSWQPRHSADERV